MVQRANQASYFIDPKIDFMGICTFCTKTCSWNRIDEHMEEHWLAIHAPDGLPVYSMTQLPQVLANHESSKKDDGDSFAIEGAPADPTDEEKEEGNEEEDVEPAELKTTPKKKGRTPKKKDAEPAELRRMPKKKAKTTPKKKGRTPKKKGAKTEEATTVPLRRSRNK
jgi:hypothetical protein